MLRQVDMKIMYYELIKMLIDYERRNHPETYDATKTVGKIEGYQELTNKLQRYLNQRFIVDIDELGKEQTAVTSMFSKNTDILQKIENLEQNFINLNEKNQNLLIYVEKVEKVNTDLLAKISALEDKVDTEIIANIASINLRHEEFESKHEADVSLVKVAQADSKQILEETARELEKDSKRVENKLTNLYNEQKEDLEEKTNTKLAALTGDIEEKINSDKADIIKRIEKAEDRIEVLENAGPEITKHLVEELDGRMKELQGNTNNSLKTIEEKVNINITEIEQGKNEQRRGTEEVEKLVATQESISNQLEAFNVRTEESWRSVETVLAERQQNMVQLQALLDVQGVRLGQVEADAGSVVGQLEAVQKTAEATHIGVTDVATKMAEQVKEEKYA